MDAVLEGRTYYQDKDGNEITQEEFEKLQAGGVSIEAETKSKKTRFEPKNEGGL